MTIRDIIWLTGFYEGEGSTGCYNKTSYAGGKKYTYKARQLSVAIAQKQKDIILWILKTVGYGSIYGGKKYAGHFGNTGVWFYHCSWHQAERFLQMIRPFMKCSYKMKQVDSALKKWHRHARAK